jgi:hypothetical protein
MYLNMEHVRQDFFMSCREKGFDKTLDDLCREMYRLGIADGEGTVIYTDGTNDHIIMSKGIPKYGSR